MAGSKRRKGPTFSMVEEILNKQKDSELQGKKQDSVKQAKKTDVKKEKSKINQKQKKQVKVEKQEDTDKILEEMQQARIKFKDTIKQIAKRKSEIEKKTEWHYRMKEAAENDRNRREQYAHIVSASLSKNNTMEER